MKKLSVLVIGAAGYVLGSRAGRERYEQIKRQATKAWNKPVVQDAVDNVEQAVKSTASDVGYEDRRRRQRCWRQGRPQGQG